MTQQQRIIYVRALDCEKAPDNPRTVSDPIADAQLEANVGETGMIIQNLIGLEIRRKKGRYQIYGGGRRLDSVHANIANGTLDEDYMVPVLPAKDKKQALSMSLDENFYKLSMNPADECRAFQAVMDAEKKTAAEIAKQRGLTEKFVKGRLRLANLAPVVFEALRSSDITLDVAQAYGSITDTDRQAKVFEQLAGGYQSGNTNEIRRQLAIGSFRGGDAKAVLAGREAYLESGGRIESDLFSDQSTELWLDGDIVERLVEDKLTAAAEEVRLREGFAEVRVLPATFMPYEVTRQLDEMEPEPLEMSDEAAARHAAIEAELAEMERIAEETDGYTEDQAAQVEALHVEMDRLATVETGFTPAQKAGAIAYMMIDREGNPKLHEEIFAVETPEERAGDPEDDDDLMGTEGDEDFEGDEDLDGDDGDENISLPAATVEEDDGSVALKYTGRLRDEMAVMKTNLLAIHIANDPQFALDLGTFIMVDDVCKTGWNGMPSDLRLKEPSNRAPGFTDVSMAAQSWAKLDEALNRTWLNHKSLEDRYDAFCALSDGERAAWLGWAVASSMQAIPEGTTGFDFLNHLGGKLEIDVASWWRPDANTFFDGLTRSMMLGLFESVGGRDLRNRYSGSRKFELAIASEKLFSGEAFVEPEVKERAIKWVPEPMRFAPFETHSESEAPAVIGEDIAPAAIEPDVETAGEDLSAPLVPASDAQDLEPATEPAEPVVEANDDEAVADLPEAA